MADEDKPTDVSVAENTEEGEVTAADPPPADAAAADEQQADQSPPAADNQQNDDQPAETGEKEPAADAGAEDTGGGTAAADQNEGGEEEKQAEAGESTPAPATEGEKEEAEAGPGPETAQGETVEGEQAPPPDTEDGGKVGEKEQDGVPPAAEGGGPEEAEQAPGGEQEEEAALEQTETMEEGGEPAQTEAEEEGDGPVQTEGEKKEGDEPVLKNGDEPEPTAPAEAEKEGGDPALPEGEDSAQPAEGEKEGGEAAPAEGEDSAQPAEVKPEAETEAEKADVEQAAAEESPAVDDGQGVAPATQPDSALAEPEEITEGMPEKGEAMFPLPKLDATATVKFVLHPSGQVSTLASPLKQSIASWRVYFSGELKMVEKLIIIQLEGKRLDGTVTIGDLGVPANGMIQLEIVSADPVNHPLKSLKPKAEYVMPDVITVRVQRDEGEFEDIVVEIERSRFKKPFLGGYKHRFSGAEYHHAGAQTLQRARADTGVERFCRDTQTVVEKQQLQQVTVDTSTQMTGVGVYVANLTDKLLTPGHYTTADQLHATILKKIIVLQSYFRRWQAKRTVESLRQDLAKRLDWERREEVRKIQEKEERIKKEFERRMNPKTKEDFDLLYAALEKWRKEELEVIDSTTTRAERKAELCQLLDEETQLITAIGRHKIQAENENKQRRIQKFLDQAAAPKKWKAHDGKFTEMDTPYTVRARELKDIYNSINMKYLTQDERLDVLLTLKHTVKEHDCKLTQEIVDLIDREADLLMRGVKEANLEGLRKRISTLFLQYIRTPTFNPEAARLLKVPQDPSVLRKHIHFCSGCSRYLPSTEFHLASNSRLVGRCRMCMKVDNEARARQDLGHYRYLLKLIRATEEHYADNSRIAFLVQEADLRYLVENIWSCQSVLSSWDDLFDLTLVRWNLREEWSPWNCILLTKDEAAAHMKLTNLEESYGRVFCHKVQSKHTLARNYFSRLPGMVQLMRRRAGELPPSALPPSTTTTEGGLSAGLGLGPQAQMQTTTATTTPS